MKHAPANQIPLPDLLSQLGEPLRLRLLRVLEREELTVGELARVVQVPQSTVSRHLKVLSDGGWLASRNEGTSTLHRLLQDDLEQPHRAIWQAIREPLVAIDGPTAREFDEDLRRVEAVLAERRTDTQAFFGRLAGQWDSVRQELFGSTVTLRALLPLIPPDWVVADIGCGTGNAAELLAPCVKQVVCVDQSDVMLHAAERRLKMYPNIRYMQGDLEKLPIESGLLDAAVCVLVLHHINDPAIGVKEMARCLKPGGVCLVVDMVEHDRHTYRQMMGHRWLGFGVPQLVRMMTEAGLVKPRIQVLPAETEAKGPGLFVCTAHKPITGEGPVTGR